jgi:hypothetical protein
MKTKKKVRGSEAAPNTKSKVLLFPSSETAQKALNTLARQRAVRSKLNDIVCTPDSTAPVAVALVSVLPDGSVEYSATGIERDFSQPVADSLDRLSHIVRMHSATPRRARSSQHGFSALPAAISLAFMAATYVNQIAWIDSLLMLTSHLIVEWITKRRPRS